MAESYITDSMLDMFLYESGQNLEQLETIALSCEKSKELTESDVNEIFRIMHTIKGSSGIMMYNDITTCAHSLEDVFYYIRESKPTDIPVDDLVALVLEADDFIGGELDKIRNGSEPDGNSGELVKKMKSFLERLKNKIKASGEELPAERKEKAVEQFYIAPVASPTSNFFHILINYRSDTEMSNVRAYTAVFSLKSVAEDMRYIPEDIITNESTADVILRDGFNIYLQAQIEEDELMRLIDHSSGVSNIEVERITPDQFLNDGRGTAQPEIKIDLDGDIPEAPKKKGRKKKGEEPAGDVLLAPPAEEKKVSVSEIAEKSVAASATATTSAATPAKSAPAGPKQTFISVNVSKMDELMDLIGELVIAEAVVVQNPEIMNSGLDLTNFQKASSQLSKITSELQDVIMGMRMMPLSPTFQKMNRIVFDASRKLDKDIDLEIIGENTEVDKNIIEHISDPLMHLVRNSVDHGIESKEDRAKTDKPARGKIVLEAKNEGGKVWIMVKDDGGGLNKEKILAKAKANGLLGNKSEKDFTDKEIFNFITLPGFSTKEQVTELSGRGVGMDVVVQNIQKVGGSLEIDSKLGVGSTMTIKIPLTLAIIEGIIVRVGTNSYIMSTADIREFVSIKQSQMLVEPEGNESIMLRGECYPVIRLKEMYHLESGVDDVEEGIMAILEYEGRKAAVFVDELVGQQEIVVKPIPQYIKKVKGISGCTQLGDGSISLILDTGSLLKD